MQKIAKIVALVLGVVSIVLWVLLLGKEDPYSNLMFYIAYILIAIGIAIVLIFTIMNLLSHPDKLKKSLISIVGFVVVLALSYVLSKGTDINLSEMADKGVTATESTSKIVGAGLITFYILTAIAAGTMIVSGIKKLIAK